jgi:glycolate oxidase
MNVQYSSADLAVQMRIKSVFDPSWLLNPGKVFPLEEAQASASPKADEAA